MKGFGRLSTTNVWGTKLTVKFIYIVFCFIFALGSYFLCHSKRDWGWLAGGMAFTVGADYFLILHDAHVPGVAVFCFAHVCYIVRRVKKPQWVFLMFPLVFVWNYLMAANGNIMGLAVMYAALFVVNITINIKTRRTGHNGSLVLAGLILFALCDINVALFNIPRYSNALPELIWVFTLIWVFYIPAQGLLAISAINFKRLRRKSYG
jgi:hypothetical protein